MFASYDVYDHLLWPKIDSLRRCHSWFVGRRNAAASYAFEESLNVRGAMDERTLPEVVTRIFDQLDEGNQKTPWVRSVHDETLKQNSGDLLHDDVMLGMKE